MFAHFIQRDNGLLVSVSKADGNSGSVRNGMKPWTELRRLTLPTHFRMDVIHIYDGVRLPGYFLCRLTIPVTTGLAEPTVTLPTLVC